MTKIHKLPQNVVNKIAAGEVVERPASVLKELLENSLDAGATQINIDIEEGGKKLIRVQDNGEGMDTEDLLASIQPHTTSKISELEDLFSLDTFGFRGEALASIASVSRFSIRSKRLDATGQMLTLNEDGEVNLEETAMPDGTIVEVADIFFNVPARKKFMKSDQTELRNLIDVFTNIAIVNPRTTFKFSHNGKVLFHMPGEETSNDNYIAEARVKKTLALEESADLISVFYDGAGISVSGFIGHPSLSAGRITDQFVFVNRRYVNDKIVSKAVREGFGTFIPEGKFPVFVVSINLRGDLVDVNVHPRKTEVKFQDPNNVFGAIKKAVKEALQHSLDFSKEATPFVGQIDTYEEKNDLAVMRLRESDNIFQGSRASKSSSWSQKSSKSEENIQNSLEFTKHLLESDHSDSEQNLDKMFHEHQNEAVFDVVKAVQMHNRYLVVEAPGEIQVWDQHAAAERIRYEKLLKEYETKGIEKQLLLSPIHLSISQKQITLVEEFADEISQLGFEIEVFGKDEIKINSVPQLLVDADIEAIVKDLVNEIDENSDTKSKTTDIEKNHDYYIKTLACHSSVTANMHLEPSAVQGFISDLKKCENPYSCPHGRPIIWRIPLKDIDKKFDR